MYLLDTDYMSLMQRGTVEGQALFRRLMSGNIAPTTTIVTYEEQMRGWLDLLARSTKFEAQVRAYQLLHQHTVNYQRITVLPFDAVAIQEYQNLRKAYPRLGKMDLKIAAIAMTNGAILLTRNQRDFSQITSLRSEDWL
jgi:tRNA(fMet)-specific endonuclease VapC